MTLPEIRENLEHFKVVKCKLSHEVVAMDRNSGKALKTEVSGETVYSRVNLCAINERKIRLGCAHSSANHSFNELLNKLPKNDSILEGLQKEFNDVVLQIYQLDHVKGNLERDFALNSDVNFSGTISEQEIRFKLNECEDLHGKSMDRLDSLRKALIKRIDELIIH